MAKDKNRPQNPAAPEPPTPVADETPSPEPAVDAPAASAGSPADAATAIDRVDAELAEADPDSLADLVPILPHKRKDLLALRKVHREEFDAALGELPEQLRANFRDLLDRMNPARESREMGEPVFRPMTLRLYQGVGEKPKNPKLPKGGVEDASGNLVLVPEDHKDMFEGVPQKLVVSVLFMANGRAFWPPRGPDGQPQMPAGLEIKGNQMICGSNDRIMGSRYGKCDACPYKPSFDKKEKACKDHVDLFVAKPDLSAIYQITLGVTSFRTALNVITGKANSWKKDHMGQFALEPLLIEKPGQNYYVWKASPVTSRQEPNGVMNDPKVVAVMDLLLRQIRSEVYFPRLASIYARSGGDGATTAAGSLADIESAAAGADYSSGAGGASGNINA